MSPLLEMESYAIFQAHSRLVKLTPSFHIQKGLLKPQSWNYAGSVEFCCSVVFDSLQPHGVQHPRPPCPSPTPGVLLKLMSIALVMPSNHLILCHPLLLLLSILPSIRVFSNESVLHIKWSKY